MRRSSHHFFFGNEITSKMPIECEISVRPVFDCTGKSDLHFQRSCYAVLRRQKDPTQEIRRLLLL